ncbi:MAG: hypothetical protein ACAH88_18430 [Roseimicrobium sp.]
MTSLSAIMFLACPECNYERVLPTWVIFTSLRLLVTLAVAHRRLDLVRTLGAFIAFEVVYYHTWKLVVWYSHPAVAEGVVEWVAIGSLFLLSIGIPAVAVLLGLSKTAYFRARQPVRLTVKRAVLLLPAMFILAVIQGL